MLLEPELSERSIRSFSYKVMRRLHSAGDRGRNFSLEDIQQELRIAWIKASESYDASMGIPFQPYLVNGMKKHVNRLIEKQIGRRMEEVGALSLDGHFGEDDGKKTLADIIPDEDSEVGAEFEADQHFEYVTRKLKPRAKQFITILYKQPVELLEQVAILREKAEYGRTVLGVDSPATNRLATWMVFDLMDASQVERADIVKEIRALGNRLCEVMSK